MQCNICGGTAFTDMPKRPAVRCADCGSLERTRVAALHITEELRLASGSPILHFAPERGLSVLTVGMAMDEESAASSLDHAHRVFAALADWDTGGVWPNFGVPHDAVSARRSYSEQTLARLREVVDTYDPQGVLQAGAYTRAVA